MQAAPQSDPLSSANSPVRAQSDVIDDNTRERWMAWLISMVPNCRWIRLCHSEEASADQTTWCYPSTAPLPAEFSTVASKTFASDRPVQLSVLENNQAVLLLGFNLECEHSTGEHALVVASDALDDAQKQATVHLCRWAAHWLNAQLIQTKVNTASANTHTALDGDTAANDAGADAILARSLLSNLSRHGDLNALSFTLVKSVAELCGCSRVSLAQSRLGKIRLLAISGQSKIDQRRLIGRRLHSAMHEALSAHTSSDAAAPINKSGEGQSSVSDVGVSAICYQHGKSALALPSHAALFKTNQNQPLLSLCLSGDDNAHFVLMLERPADAAFAPAQIDAITRVIKPVAALLAMVQQSEQGLRESLTDKALEVKNSWSRIGLWSKRRTILVSVLCALGLAAIVPVPHRVAASAVIEAADRQVLVAPQDGFVLSAHARAGEYVDADSLLATLDTSTLNLMSEKWQSEMNKNRQEYAQALAQHDRSELSRLRADAKRIAAEMSLIQKKMQKSELRAPFSGVLMQGDWSQKLGAPVISGDVLFEIASAEQYRLVLEVDEHDIAYVDVGQQAQLRMASLPNLLWDANLDAVLPVAVSEKGQSVFRIPATIVGEASRLRPGMQGIAKVHVGQRSILWVYTHSLIDRLRYVAWKLGVL